MRRPLPGTVVTDGVNSVISDGLGHFRWKGRANALSFIKPGFSDKLVPLKSGLSLPVELRVSSLRGRLAWRVDGARTELSGLESALGAWAKSKLRRYPEVDLNQVDLLVLLMPRGLASSETIRILNWVRRGGRLLVCGEWGGERDFDKTCVNALVQPAGIQFTGATLKSNAEDPFRLVVTTPEAAPLLSLEARDAVTMWGTCELSLSGPARPLLVSKTSAYSVLAIGDNHVVAAVGPLGRGKVMAVADTSLWRDSDSSGVGKPNLETGANRRLLERLLVW
ncbi:MAG: DUF4350 domain-containing protein [Candidatus Sericytochromatia bacterium]|nr:DUF4350 domain-containing protein [Candidatus Sericytochromatia bacterium]